MGKDKLQLSSSMAIEKTPPLDHLPGYNKQKDLYMTRILILIVLLFLKQGIVQSQNVAVELTNMNILYKYVPNNVKIVVQDTPCENVVVKTMVGKLTRSSDKDSCHYYYYTTKCGENKEQFIVGVKDDGNIKWIDTLNYRLKDDAKKSIWIHFIGIRNGLLDKHCVYYCDTLWFGENQSSKLTAPLINFDIELEYEIVKYSVEIIRNDTVIYSSYNIPQATITKELYSQIQESMSNDKVRFFDVGVQFDDCVDVFEGVTVIIK